VTEQPTTPPELAGRPMPRLGVGVRWGAHLDKPIPPTEPYKPPARRRPTGGWPKTGDVGASAHLADDEQPVTVPARAYDGTVEAAPGHRNGCQGCEHDEGVFPLCWSEDDTDAWFALFKPPPAAELRAIADDLNAHGGLDETFVAELLRQAADPYADAKRGLGIVDLPPAPVKTTEPITYESIVEALEKIAPLGPQRLDVVKLTQAQIDAVTASQPHAVLSAEPWHYFGTPVEIVDTVEESTPYQLWREQTEAAHGLKVVGETPSGVILGNPAWLMKADREPDPVADLVPDGVQWEPGKLPEESGPQPVLTVVDNRPARDDRPWWRRALDRVRRWTR
jgi:hypothetical protein